MIWAIVTIILIVSVLVVVLYVHFFMKPVQPLPLGVEEYTIALTKIGTMERITSVVFHQVGVFTTSKTGVVSLSSSLRDDAERHVIHSVSDADPHFYDTHMEAGLMSIALHPDFSVNRRLYLSYTIKASASGTYSVVNEYVLDPSLRSIAFVRTLFKLWHTTDYHHAGTLVFGRRGVKHHLYLSMGDGGPQGDPEMHAQNPASFRGKIIRFDVDGDEEPKIIALGLRNPWKITIAPDGEMLIGDVGLNKWERIYRLNINSDTVPNYGWPLFEGIARRDSNADQSQYVMPDFEYPVSNETGRATVGGYRIAPSVYLIADWYGQIRIIKANEKGKLIQVGMAMSPDQNYTLAHDPHASIYYAMGLSQVSMIGIWA